MPRAAISGNEFLVQLERPLLKLPIRFAPDVLAAEVDALPASAWVSHPTGFAGNEAVRLVTPGGEDTDDLKGQMAPTEHLLACRYVMQAMAEIGSVWGRSRLMGLGAGADVPSHVDSHYYWRTHWRIHIPVITNPAVTFSCGGETVHMAAGECWLFDSFRVHTVHNGGSKQRIHLVLDTVGGGRLRDMIDSAQRGGAEPRLIAPEPRNAAGLTFERVNAPVVMSPWEIREHVAFLAGHARPHPLLEAVLRRLDRFAEAWAAVWAEFETAEAGWPQYLQLLEALKRDLLSLGGAGIALNNNLRFYLVLDHMVLLNMFADPDAVAARASQATMPMKRLAS